MKPVSKTAYYCATVRAWDADSPNPILGDQYAQLFLNDEVRGWMERYRPEQGPNYGNVVRHRIIEDILRAELAADPKRLVVVVGAGFDTTAFRMPAGRFVEVDEPQVFAEKEPKLPAGSCPNALERIPIDFETQTLTDVLAKFRGERSVTVIVEGVLMYLTVAQRQAMVDRLIELFPAHTLLCDNGTTTFMRRYSKTLRARLAEFGAHFGDLLDDPPAWFGANGYRVRESHSVVERGNQHPGAPLRVPGWLLKTFLRTLANGYRIWYFERTG
ncbi:MAG: class I SAM-dependent methyltransferase [Gemmatimonadales bacterium]